MNGRSFGREVVIEAVVGRRAEGDLRAGEQVLHRLRHHVREVVAGELQRVGLVLRRHQRELGVALERPRQVAQLAVDPRGDRRLGEPGPIAAAMSAGVVPGATSRTEPSGSVMRNMADIGSLRRRSESGGGPREAI